MTSSIRDIVGGGPVPGGEGVSLCSGPSLLEIYRRSSSCSVAPLAQGCVGSTRGTGNLILTQGANIHLG